MKRARILFAIAVCLLLLTNISIAQTRGDRARRSDNVDANRLIELLQLESAFTDAVAATIVQMTTLFPDMKAYEDILIDYAEEQLDWETIKTEIAHWYVEAFTEQELRELIQFHESPLGRKWTRSTALFATRMEQLVRTRFDAELDLLELRMKNRDLDQMLEASVFFDADDSNVVIGE